MTGPTAPRTVPAEDLWCELANDLESDAAPETLWGELAALETP